MELDQLSRPQRTWRILHRNGGQSSGSSTTTSSRSEHSVQPVREDDEIGLAAEPTANAVDSLAPITRRDQIIALIVGFLCIMQTIGPTQSYGVWQEFYVSSPHTPLPPDEASSRASIALIGTAASGLCWGLSIAVHPLVNYVGSHRYVALAGGLLMSIAFLGASFSDRFWKLLLTQGLLYGIGASMLYFPLISVVPPYFDSHRGAATGLTLSAAGIGGLMYSLATRALLDSIGSQWTLRAMAVENALVCIPIALAARKSRTDSPAAGNLVNINVAMKPAFILQCIAGLPQAAGNFVPLTFTPEFSTILGYSASFGATLLAINNGVNAISRVLLGVVADRFGRQNLLVVTMIGSVVSVFGLWLAATMNVDDAAKGNFIAFVCVYGVMSGGFNALFPAIIPEVFPLSAYASVNSFLYFCRGVGVAFGSPVGGQILGDSRSGSTMGDKLQALQDYRNLIWYDGALLGLSALCVIGVRLADAADRKAWRWKA